MLLVEILIRIFSHTSNIHWLNTWRSHTLALNIKCLVCVNANNLKYQGLLEFKYSIFINLGI